jgi:acetoin utilization protein AcuC
MTDTKSKIFIFSEDIDKYPYPESCPFKINRSSKTLAQLDSMGMLTGADYGQLKARPATREQLLMFHTEEYINTIELASQGHFDIEFLAMGLGTGDCPVFKGLYENCLWAAGGTITAAEEILNGNSNIAFHPAGGLHHAFPEKGAGFCYVNDVVMGLETLARAGKRVMFIDIDVHHTDGVEYAFYERDDVMTVCFHESGKYLFPGTGKIDDIGDGPGRGYAVNIPLPPGTYDEIYLDAFRNIVPPLIKAFDPDVIAMEVGADTLANDPLAHLSLTNNVHADIVQMLLAYDKPMLVVGGGGYNVDNTVRAWSLLWASLTAQLGGVDETAGMGGVMLENPDWQGGAGLRDRVLVPDKQQIELVKPEVEQTVQTVKKLILPVHNISTD